jgi:hypothetical protein
LSDPRDEERDQQIVRVQPGQPTIAYVGTHAALRMAARSANVRGRTAITAIDQTKKVDTILTGGVTVKPSIA